MPWQAGETRLFPCPPIVKQNLLIAGNALALSAIPLAFLPGPSQQFNY